MIHHTLNNHLHCTYNGEHRHRKSEDDAFSYVMGKTTRKPKSFKEECIHAAKLIKDMMSEPITLLYSGGFDSEIMLESFRLAKLPFSTVFCKYKNDYNKHDLKYAEEYCNNYGIKLEILPLDLLKFWENDAFNYAKLIGCLSPQFTVLPWIMDQIGGCVVASTMDIEFRLEDDGIWRDITHEGGDSCWLRFAEIRQREIVPAFSQYTPEQIAAALPLFKEYADGYITSENNTMCCKPRIYGPEFNLKPRPKFSGFEVLDKESDVLRKEYRKELGSMYHGTIKILYEDYERILGIEEYTLSAE